jgi:hypothetical protein
MSYAVLFTTYAWDDFVARQYERITQRVQGGDVYVMADESRGPLNGLPSDRVIRTTQQEILRHGGRTAFIENGDWEVKAPLWWNLDFLTYRFFDEHQEYDYCLTMDFDACVNLDVDSLIKKVEAAGYDFVAMPACEKIDDWYWRQPHEATYPRADLHAHMLCVHIISRRASNYLGQRRREMAADYKAGKLKFWPFCEAFMPTELHRAGFRVGTLAEFGDVEDLGWEKVYNEKDIIPAMKAGFVHPVLDERRFIIAYMQRYKPVKDWFYPASPFWRQLRQLPSPIYRPHIWPIFKTRASRQLKRMGKRATGG